jgi:hypothetical protein
MQTNSLKPKQGRASYLKSDSHPQLHSYTSKNISEIPKNQKLAVREIGNNNFCLNFEKKKVGHKLFDIMQKLLAYRR